MALVLGIDVSTTATKAILVDESGTVRGIGTASYPYETPRPQWSEQDPRLWWDAAVAAIPEALAAAGVDGGQVAAVGLAGQMHGAVLLDASDEPVRPAILWNDQRTARRVRRDPRARGHAAPGRGHRQRRARPGSPRRSSSGCGEHEPDAWSRVAHLLLPKDYVRLRLTGERAIDRADAAGTLLLDLAARDWSDEILDALDLDPRILPRTLEGPDVSGEVTPEAARLTGPAAGDPGRRRRRRPGGQRGRRRRRGPRDRGALARNLRRRLRRGCRAGGRAGTAGSTPSATPCRIDGTSCR